ncbi:MAG: alpha/beta hydrolase [Clostridia bacterium]|nr:alpha/beta hydrolase [Clostridia bacterium]
MEKLNLWEEAPGTFTYKPILDYYPAENKKTDAAVVIFPGGAYEFHAEHEGKGYAEYFNSIGMDAFVCPYRVFPHHFPLPLLDARRAVRYVRANAEKFGINPDRIAVMGSSAGGHLAALVSTYTAPIAFENLDEIDTADYMPNATILCYPVIHHPDGTKIPHEGSYKNLLGETMPDLAPSLSPDLLVKDSTPPTYIWHAADDTCVDVINSYMYAAALRRHNVPCEMHIFPYGDHGIGLASHIPHTAQWVDLMKNWLMDMGWLA